jgi:hypothetical protein
VLKGGYLDSWSRMKLWIMKPMRRSIPNPRVSAIAMSVIKLFCEHTNTIYYSTSFLMMTLIRLPSRVNCACLGIGFSFHCTGKHRGSYSRYWGNSWREISVGVAAILGPDQVECRIVGGCRIQMRQSKAK